jgi:glycosyltransferase involved in cell wall biosynthesis
MESFRKEFEKCGHTVYIFAPKFKGHIDENHNVFRFPALDLNFKNIRFPIAIPYSCRIDEILKKMEIDVIHSQHPNLLGCAAKKWAKKKNIPLIFTWHTLYDKYVHFVPPFIPKKIATNWTIKNAVKYANRADQIVVPTSSIKKIIQNWGVENQNITEIPTGIDEKLLENPNGKKIRLEFGIKDSEILLVVITRFTKEKNIEFLFRAIAEVMKRNSNVKFLAGGDGDLNEKLKTFVKDRGLADKVIFTGFIPNDIKKNYYAAGDIFVFSSISETQGMILTEAHYIGLPIVAVEATGARDIVQNNETGFLTREKEKEFSNAVIKLVENAELRKKFSENAKKISREKYTSKICAQKMLAVYEQAIKRKK